MVFDRVKEEVRDLLMSREEIIEKGMMMIYLCFEIPQRRISCDDICIHCSCEKCLY